MDMRDMSEYSDQMFDLVIDKGSVDAIYCLSDQNLSVSKALKEI